MPLNVLHLQKPSFFGIYSAEFDEMAAGWGWPRYRAQQVRDWVYGKMVDRPEGMTNLSKTDRQTLAERVEFTSGEVIKHQRSSDETQKLLIKWGDANAETVMIPDRDRRTACVSSQVG